MVIDLRFSRVSSWVMTAATMQTTMTTTGTTVF